jgi:hypothetical protein
VVVDSAKKLEESRVISVLLGQGNQASFDGTTDISLGVSGILPVTKGGTGKTNLAADSVLIGNGTSGIKTQAITDNT